MKKQILVLSALVTLSALAEPINLQMPFKAGRKTTVAWWESKNCELVTEKDGTAVKMPNGQGIRFKDAIPGKAGDRLAYEITLKKKAGNLSVRLGLWSKEGHIGEVVGFPCGIWNPERSKATSEYTTFKGEIMLKDADKPDKKGIMRKVNRFYLTIYAHTDSRDVVVKDIKINLIPKQ